MVYINQKHHFNSAHKLSNPDWSDERNAEVFGPCANANWHGHNFELIVGVKGDSDPDTGFVINPEELKNLVHDEIIERVDHKNLNLDVPFMSGKMASCESLVVEFWKILEPKVRSVASNAKLHRLRLYETPRNFVDYYGE